MDAGRKCYQLIGGVLTERTIADVLPVVEQNRDGIQQLHRSIEQQLAQVSEERLAIQKKHGIKVVTPQQAQLLAAQQAAEQAQAQGQGQGQSTGVLA
jgi:prefoldin subunit 2